MGRAARMRPFGRMGAWCTALLVAAGASNVKSAEPVMTLARETTARGAWSGYRAVPKGLAVSVQPPAEVLIATAPSAAEMIRELSARAAWSGRRPVAGESRIRLVYNQGGAQPEQPPLQPEPTPPTPSTARATPLPPSLHSPSPGGAGPAATPLPPRLDEGGQVAADSPGSTYLPPSDAYNTTDAGSVFAKSPAALGIGVQKRSPIANQTYIRGYNIGQTITYADGAFWFPARQDLDTFLSKIDSGIIRDIVVVKGPYTARLGPGFAFIDIATESSPRSVCGGLEWGGRSVFTYETNGDGIYGRQMLKIADDHWGMRLSYGHRTGNDFETGRGFEIPASYNVRDFDLVSGFDLSCSSRIEFGAIRLDQTDLEFPGQIFDTKFLTTDGYRIRYLVEDQGWFDRFTIDGWYNRTVLEGNAQRASKRRQVPDLDEIRFFGLTNIDQMSVGARLAMTWGEVRDPLSPILTLGVDYRHIKQQIEENDQIFGLPCVTPFGVPRSHQGDFGGIFAEFVLPLSERLKIKAGGRVDYVFYGIDREPLCGCCGEEHNLAGFFGTDDLDRDHVLFLAYLTAEYRLSETMMLVAGFGHAQRPATLTEMYATDPFLAILQQGFTSVRGNPVLKPERLFQVDLGLHLNRERFRAGVNGFHSWIDDYITYAAIQNAKLGAINVPSTVPDALAVQYVNTERATLSGGEAYFEADVTDWLTPFGTISYVYGRDHSRNGRGAVITDPTNTTEVLPGVGALGAPKEALPMIPPLESRIGLRVHDIGDQPRWAVEFAARIVDHQEQVASSLLERRTAGFVVFDLRSYLRPRENLLLIAGVENIFDRDYREHLDLRTGLGVFQPGVNAYFGVDVRY